MEPIPIFVLVESTIRRGQESRKNVGITTDLAEAEAFAEQRPLTVEPAGTYIEFSFDRFTIPDKLLQVGAESTIFLQEIRQFIKVARDVQTTLVDEIVDNN